MAASVPGPRSPLAAGRFLPSCSRPATSLGLPPSSKPLSLVTVFFFLSCLLSSLPGSSATPVGQTTRFGAAPFNRHTPAGLRGASPVSRAPAQVLAFRTWPPPLLPTSQPQTPRRRCWAPPGVDAEQLSLRTASPRLHDSVPSVHPLAGQGVSSPGSAPSSLSLVNWVAWRSTGPAGPTLPGR